MSQQKALNNYVAYANQSAQEVTAVVVNMFEYYPSIETLKSDKEIFRLGFTCRIQLEDFYFNQALNESKILSSAAVNLNSKLKALRAIAEKIDGECKKLDTYFKLEDYKQDHYIKAGALILSMPALLIDYRQKQTELMGELEALYQKLNKYVDTNSYHKTSLMMRKQINKEKTMIDSWSLNINESTHTGWPVEKLETSIAETDTQIKSFETFQPQLKYPASSMYGSFKESLASILEIKRTGLDGYNFEAKKSDKHSNEVYLSLINYYNGTLVADYNTFIEFAMQNNFYGLKQIIYVPFFESRLEAQRIITAVKPFQDIPYFPLVTVKAQTAISKSSFEALNNYIDLINESVRQMGYLQLVIGNLNASATYYKDLTNYKGKGGLHFDYENFLMPLSLYHKTTSDSKAINILATQSLNDQSTVILNILKELDQLSASLEIETKEKKYEADNLKKLYELIERSSVLFDLLDNKKEQLYNDVRQVFESYPPKSSINSWYVSGKALQNLTDQDHDALFKAKAFYKGDATIAITTEKIDQSLRDVISNEYANMKGIERIGRNNGLCPYTPYEDLPQSSRVLSEKLNTLKPASGKGGYEHPYHEMVYHYNDIVEDLNKFSELSKEVYILKTVRQPELFFVKYAEHKNDAQQKLLEVNDPPKPNNTPKPAEQKVDVAVPLDKTKIVHDTVYIEKRDTVYIAEHDENLRSMEGYAANNMILLLDVSASMNAVEKLPLLKKSVLDLLTMMRPEDQVSIVVYSGKAKVLLPATSFKEEEKIKNVIEKLKSEGKTDGNAGLKLAYKVADENYMRGGNNRIILATDGEFSISKEVFQLVDKFANADIYITVFNFGKSSSSKNLEKLATTGKGNYEFITTENVSRKLIGQVKAKRKK